MSIEENPPLNNQTPVVSPGNYSPVTVTMHNTLGLIVLGIFAGWLLIEWRRAEARYRTLLTQMEVKDGSRSPNDR